MVSSFRLRPRQAWPLGLGVLALVAAACGGQGNAPSATTGTTAGTSPSGSAPVQVVKTALGKVLADRTGRSLYLLTSDTATGTTCTGACLTAWPPVSAPAGVTSAAGVAATLGGFSRPGGSRQLTVDGHPLYLYAGDGGPGQTNGQGIKSFGGTWWLVGPDGKAVTGSGSGPSSGSSYSRNGY